MKTVAKSQKWLDVHGRKLAIGIIGLVIVVMAVIIYNKVQSSATDDSLLAMSQARKMLAQGKKDQAEALMEHTYKQFKGTQGAAEALYSLAELKLAENDNETAEDLYGQFLKQYKKDKYLYMSALDGRAAALENLGNFEEAAKLYDKITTIDKIGYLVPIALNNAGRCYMKVGDKEKAKQRFQRILDEYERSKVKAEAEVHLAELELMK